MADEHTRLIDPINASNTLNNEQLLHTHEPLHTAHVAAHTKRLLNSRHISMISIGGIIGTGLFMGIRQTLTNGPIISIISYIYISALCYYIITAVGEMSCFMPINGSLCQFQFKFISNPVGMMNNFVYWLSWSITLGLELSLIYEILRQFGSTTTTASSLSSSWPILPNWMTSKTGIILLIWILLTAANLFPVNYYGEIEFIVTIIKVAFMISWIGLSICLVSLQIGLINWQNRELLWGINTIQVVTNPILNKVINILSSSIVSSCFTFQSIESVGICSGEIEDIGRNLPKAIKYIVMRIVLFYLGSLVLLTLMIPSNDSRLIDNNGNGDSGSAMTSPFVIALINCGVGGTSILINIVNFVILTSMISAANSNIYFGSRCLLSMVEEGYFWPQFAKTTRNGGVPVYAILLTSAIGLIISLLSNWKSMDIFLTLLINLSATTGLLMWLFISVSYLRFRATLEYNGLPYNQLSYTSSSSLLFCLPMRQASWFSIVSIVVIILSNGVTNVWQFNWDSFASCYLTSIVVIIGVVCFSYKWNEPVLKPVAEIDIFTDHSPNAFK